MKRIIILTAAVMLLWCSCACATEARNALDELMYYDLQISAVTTEMSLYLGWLPQDKEAMQKAWKDANFQLDSILDKIVRIKAAGDLKQIKNAQIEMIKQLKSFYKNIHKKDQFAIDKGIEDFQEFNRQYSAQFQQILEKYPRVKDIPEDFEPLVEEMKLIKDNKNKIIYIRALKFIDEKKFQGAYQELQKILPEFEESTFKYCILLRMSDCLLNIDSDIEVFNQDARIEHGIKLLKQILDSWDYSPVIAEAFYKCRTATQQHSYGMSNLSQIPNDQYNKKRYKAVKAIQMYLRQHPEDLWAQMQLDILLSLPNINRGGPLGNDNLMHWTALYTDFSESVDLEDIYSAQGEDE